MRNFFVLLFLAVFSVSTAYAADAASTPAAAAPKIGVVDMQTVATNSDPAKSAKDQMEKKYGKERKALEDEGEKLRKRAEKLKDPKSSEDAKLSFLRAKQELDQKTRTFMRKVEQDEVKIRQEMVTLVFNATYNVSKRKNFTFVVDVTAGGVLYAEESMDLTQDVLEEVNKLFKEQGSKPKADAKDAKPSDKK
ncbi:MAG: OmpH family outer membrane protein [Desulfovibrionaceae bacterium]|nr:OmpH family outer membrane protein [Desulfovibrionaceae bacterium]